MTIIDSILENKDKAKSLLKKKRTNDEEIWLLKYALQQVTHSVFNLTSDGEYEDGKLYSSYKGGVELPKEIRESIDLSMKLITLDEGISFM